MPPCTKHHTTVQNPLTLDVVYLYPLPYAVLRRIAFYRVAHGLLRGVHDLCQATTYASIAYISRGRACTDTSYKVSPLLLGFAPTCRRSETWDGCGSAQSLPFDVQSQWGVRLASCDQQESLYLPFGL